MRTDETPAAELWSRTLFKIPTVFGRLVYLASLRDPNSGLYRHFGFEQRVTPKESDRTIRRSHVTTFADWLWFDLEEQREDLETYLATVEGGKDSVLEAWREWPPFMNWIPAQSRPADRELFRSDLEIVLELVRRDFDVSSPGRTA